MIALAFSGGKDSWACLWLNRYRLADIVVVWVNTGKNYPELLESIAAAREMCPNFVEIPVDREAQNAAYGIPSDIVPMDWTVVGQIFTGKKPVTIQSYFDCCSQNIGYQLQAWCETNGVTELIRGQRLDEGHKSPARDGTTINGVHYSQPIENWTAQRVLDYVEDHMPLPEHFRFKHSSMDCYDCTAYRKDSADRVAFMRETYPMMFAEYSARKAAVDAALMVEGLCSC